MMEPCPVLSPSEAGMKSNIDVHGPSPQHGEPPLGGFAEFRHWLQEHFHQTVTYCFAYGSLGMCVALLGPTLLDLGCVTAYPLISTLSWVIFAQGLFSVVGSRSVRTLTKWAMPNTILFVAAGLLAATIAVIPLCSNIAFLLVVVSVMGFLMGTVDVISNVCMMQLHQGHVGPFVQSLHFCYGLGAFLTPLLVEPYLTRNGCSVAGTSVPDSHHMKGERLSTPEGVFDDAGYGRHDEKQSSLDGLGTTPHDALPHNYSSSHPHEQHARMHSLERGEQSHVFELELEHAFWLIAAVQIPTIVLTASLVIRKRLARESEEEEAEVRELMSSKDFEMKGMMKKWPDVGDQGNSQLADPRRNATEQQTRVVTGLASIMTFLADGLQAVFASYIFSYAVRYVNGMNALHGVHLTASFWGMFAFGRFMSIGLATRISAVTILLVNAAGTLISTALMVFFPHNHAAFYMGSALFGLFLSSTFPTVTSLVGSYILINPAITTQLVISAVVGETTLPVVLGYFFENLGPESFLFTILFLCLVNMTTFFALYKRGTAIVPPAGQPGPMEVLCGALFAGSATSSSSTHAEASALLCGSAGGEKIQVYSRLDGGEATVDDLDFNTADSSRGVLRGRQMTDN